MPDIDLTTVLGEGDYLKRQGGVLVGDVPASGVDAEGVVDAVAAAFAAGTHTNVTVTYNDAAGTISFTAAGLDSEAAIDAVAAALAEGAGIDVAYDDTAGTITITFVAANYFGTLSTARLLDGDTGQFGNITIVDDDTSTGSWPERFRWNYQRFSDGRTRRVFFLNEYGEGRFIPAKDNTIPLRIFSQEFASDGTRDTSVPLFEIQDNRDDRNVFTTINNEGNAWFAGSLAVDGELFFDAEALAAALETIVLEAADPAPAVGVWLRKPA